MTAACARQRFNAEVTEITAEDPEIVRRRKLIEVEVL
jgi:hypothetical protein